MTPFNNKSDYAYVWIPEWVMPEYIMEECNLKPLTQNGRVLYECRTFIYGIPQAGCFAYINLVKDLSDDYYLSKVHTEGLF